MPFKDTKVKKEYSRNWYLRKKSGLPTRTTIPLSQEERQKRWEERKLKMIESRRMVQKKCRQLIIDTFGEKCKICSNNKRKFAIHRKDGKPHKKFTDMGIKELRKTLEEDKDSYIKLCMDCHNKIHGIMDFLDIGWNEIEQILIKKGKLS